MSEHIFPQPAWQIVDTPGADGKNVVIAAATNYIGGLTKRELFAAMAMQGCLANEWWTEPRNKKDSALVFVAWADALIARLEGK